MMASSAPVSFICFRPLAAITASTSLPSPTHSASNTCLAALLLMVLSLMRAISWPSWALLTLTASMPISSVFRRREISPITQLLASLGWPQALAVSSK